MRTGLGKQEVSEVPSWWAGGLVHGLRILKPPGAVGQSTERRLASPSPALCGVRKPPGQPPACLPSHSTLRRTGLEEGRRTCPTDHQEGFLIRAPCITRAHGG